ncbi:hypothetical protein, partial [Salmonella sp. s51228]|uniref:hypothetical protein n=1 Tax=Salmonella sp. s51228 TaxID=3159652 RepID=UPI00397FED60
RSGNTPVNVMWYYKENKADSQIADLSQDANPNGDTSLTRYGYKSNAWKEGYYYINVSNAYGYDYQITRIVFVPKWSHRWESNEIFNRETGFFGETLRVDVDSELRLTEYVVQGTKSWTIKHVVNGELVAESGPEGDVIYNNDFRIEKSGDRYTLVLSSFQSIYSGTYTAYVSNEFGSDSITSTIV